MKRLLALAISAGLLSSAASATSPWDGTYLFEQSIGTGSNVKLFVNHKLTLGPDGCRIDAEGYQTYEHILCTATPSGNKLDVLFARYAEDEKINVNGAKTYEPNQKLFTLHRSGDAVTTEWAGYAMNKDGWALLGRHSFKKLQM